MRALCSAKCIFRPQPVWNKLSGLFSQVLASLASMSKNSTSGWFWLTLPGSCVVVIRGQVVLILQLSTWDRERQSSQVKVVEHSRM